jgi:hypothetical protein
MLVLPRRRVGLRKRTGDSAAYKGTAARSLLLFAAALVSALLVNLCGWLLPVANFVDDLSGKPVAQQTREQLEIPAVMPYDVWVIEPWGAAAARNLLAVLFYVAVLFVAWAAANTIASLRARRATTSQPGDVQRLHHHAIRALFVYWVLSLCLLLALGKVLADASHGIPPYG